MLFLCIDKPTSYTHTQVIGFQLYLPYKKMSVVQFVSIFQLKGIVGNKRKL